MPKSWHCYDTKMGKLLWMGLHIANTLYRERISFAGRSGELCDGTEIKRIERSKLDLNYAFIFFNTSFLFIFLTIILLFNATLTCHY